MVYQFTNSLVYRLPVYQFPDSCFTDYWSTSFLIPGLLISCFPAFLLYRLTDFLAYQPV